MDCGGVAAGGRLDGIDQALCGLYPEWTPLTDAAKAAIRASVAAAPEPSEAQRIKLARLLRGAWTRE